jgi:1-deoxy-D-xylulose-5-phosphate synthase
VNALHTACALADGPVAIRYPRAEAPSSQQTEASPEFLVPGKALRLRSGSAVSLLALGRMVPRALEVAEELSAVGIEAAVYNMLWVKPLDLEAVSEAATAPLLVTLEEGTTVGGFGSAVCEALAEAGVRAKEGFGPGMPRVLTLGIPDTFVTHGSVDCLFEELKLDTPQLLLRIRDALNAEVPS